MKNIWDQKVPKAVILLLFLLDIVIINFSSFLALWIRFDMSFGRINRIYLERAYDYWLIHTAITLLCFVIFQLYASLWRFASVRELINIICAGFLSMILQILGMHIMNFPMPRSYYPMSFVIMTSLVAVSRYSYRILRIVRIHLEASHRKPGGRVMIVGAGDAGVMLLREFKNSSHLHKTVECMIDDDTAKKGKMINGVRIIGGRDLIEESVKKYDIDEIIIAMPAVERQKIRDILDICKKTGCELRILPGVYQLINGDVSISNLRRVNIEDLLGREPVELLLNNVMAYVKDKVVMVTGGGGSIGSELCRQIAGYSPRQLIIFDVYENNAYDIQQELKKTHPELDLVVLIGSVLNTARINSVIAEHRPDIIYHAAAHKHVPLMEDSPNEAIKNNVMGTYKTAEAACRYGVKKFILISTDKAVRPTNIMGASKRICEMIIQSFNELSSTEFAAVRFGNVLGSNGSVIPLFKKQIEAGGPVEVTHPDIIRYFMTIPEAVSLVLQAGAYAKGGEIFILDMGAPVKILDLAENLIRLSGYVPYEEIEIKFIGLRPGEKLFEELLLNEEGKTKTANDRIFIGHPDPMDPLVILKKVRELGEEAKLERDIHEAVKAVVPEYTYKTQGEREAAAFCDGGDFY